MAFAQPDNDGARLMVKILGGLLAALLIAAGGFFGFEFYVQQRVAGEVESAFAELRASGAKATHGRVSFDLWSRTIVVADIAGESAAQPPVSVKVGRFAAAGVSQPEQGRFAAQRIEATDAEVGGTIAGTSRLGFTYKAPRVEIVDYAGPASPLRALNPADPADIYRFVLEHFAAVTAASASLPSMTGKVTAPAGAALGGGDYTYAGLTLRDIRAGKIASIAIDRVAFSAVTNTDGKTETMSGEIKDLAALEFDSAVSLAIFDSARANDNNYYRAYRQMKAGAYSASFGQKQTMRIERMSIDDVGLRPSRLQFPQLAALIDAVPAPGATPDPAQMRGLLEKVAGIYEGLRIGGAELHGLSMDTPDGPLRLATTRLGTLENGKLAEFALEGLEARSAQGPVKLGRFALKSIDVANLMRSAGQFAAAGRNPSPDQLAALLALLEGTEIRNLTAPYRSTGQPVNIDTLSLMWGQFVGPLPTRVRATLKMSGPVDASDPQPFNLLAGAGLTSTSVTFDLGAAWNESARTLALEPATLEVGNVLTAAARVSVGNVVREVFSINPLQAALMAAQAEAGPLEVALRDTGGVDLMVAQYARTQNLPRDAARRALVTQIRASAMQMASNNPDAMAIAGAVSRFIETPRGTLTVKLTPRGKVAMMELVGAVRKDPLAALARFQVEASNGR